MGKTVFLLLVLTGVAVYLFYEDYRVKDRYEYITDGKEAPMHAWLDRDNFIIAKLGKKINVSDNRHLMQTFEIFDRHGNKEKLLKVKPLDGHREKASLFSVETEKKLNIQELYIMRAPGCRETQVFSRKILDRKMYTYSGDDLGLTYSKDKSKFKLWAPTAKDVKLLIFDNYNDDLQFAKTEKSLSRSSSGTWEGTVTGDLKNKYYLYEISIYQDGELKKNIVADPYSKGSGVDSCKSFIFDPDETNSQVEGWSKDNFVSLKNNVDAVIYELHVRDYSIDETSGIDQELRGKYSGLSKGSSLPGYESVKTILGNIEELGVTHVHLLPTYDYGTGDEAEINSSYTWYNWGYDPVLYFNPEGSYASDPNTDSRIIEYKQMVRTYHERGVGVVFDVVFNHTFQTGDREFSIFDKIVPYYFYRVSDDGVYSNGSFCGNEFATERPMARKFIVDNLKYWVKEYHIDGLRFDLMGLIDTETMKTVYSEIKKINPSAIIYGEAWNMPSIYPSDKRMIQKNVCGTGIAAFNDGIRDNVKGDALNNNAKGFVQGAAPMTGIDRLKKQIKGQSTGRDDKSIPVETPNESVNYVSCHDNLCLWDKLKATEPDATDEHIRKMDMMAFAITATSQGILFFGEGDEFGRTKMGVDNSFDNNDPHVNPIKWNLKKENSDLFDFYKGMIALRKAHPAFRMTNSKMVDKHLKFINKVPDHVIAYFINGNANGDSWRRIFVGFNSGSESVKIKVPGSWQVAVSDKGVDLEGKLAVNGEIIIPPCSSAVAFKK